VGDIVYVYEAGIELDGREPISAPWPEVLGVSPLPMTSDRNSPITKALAEAAKQLNTRPLAVHAGRVTKRKKLTFSDGRTATVEELEPLPDAA
jgi:hypothetical protein